MTENRVPKLIPNRDSSDDGYEKREDDLFESGSDRTSSFWDILRIDPKNYASRQTLQHPDTQTKARLLYEYCISSGKKVTESVNSLYAIAEHYSGENPGELESPEVINGIPIFFKSLSAKDKSEFC